LYLFLLGLEEPIRWSSIPKIEFFGVVDIFDRLFQQLIGPSLLFGIGSVQILVLLRGLNIVVLGLVVLGGLGGIILITCCRVIVRLCGGSGVLSVGIDRLIE
jgi:hypothetical protein